MYKIINKLKDKGLLIPIIIVLVGIILIIIGLVLRANLGTKITYNEIESKMKNNDTFLIYYYNSSSKNKNNKKIKKYLDNKGIRYYKYNDKYVRSSEYDKFVELLKIDKNLLGVPAIIYIKKGEMYGNIINIDGTKIVDKFIELYDLYHVK